MPVSPRDVTKSNPLKGVFRRKELKRKREYNRENKTKLEHSMDKVEKKSCFGKPKGCSREKRKWRHPRSFIASELLKIARELLY